MIKKGRARFLSTDNAGENNGRHKLTGEDVLAMRKRHAVGNIELGSLAILFGVSKSETWAIINRKRWKCIK